MTALTAALLEFVWQGLWVAFLLWIALFILRNRSARARYAASCVALAAMVVLPAITALLAYTAPAESHSTAAWLSAARPAVRGAMAVSPGASFDWAAWLDRWALPAWSLGVLLFSLRLVWAARRVTALRRQAQPAEAAVLAIVAGLRERMKLTRPVRVLTTATTDCPSLVGWFRPAVLLPAATILGLTPQQLEAVLAHELAHILRYDHLVNMLQTLVETLLFYHPAVWWVSGRIRQERELCCDDVAVDSCGDALCYARALTRLERLRLPAPGVPGVALGSTGGPLLYRIRRIMGEARQENTPSKLPAILALSLGLVCFAFNMQRAHGQQDAPAPEAMSAESGVTDDPGVRVYLHGATVIHREAVAYPQAAVEKNVRGTVTIEATLDAAGVVSDARVLSGPAELRKAALQSVLQWHFTHDAAGSTRQVAIAFETPAPGAIAQHSDDRAKRRAEARELAAAAGGQARAAKRRRELQQREMVEESEAQAKQMAELAEQLEAGRAAQLKLPQTAELENQLRILRDHQAELSGASSLMEAHRSQMAELEKHLAELKSGWRTFDDHLFFARKVKSITVLGLTPALREELLSKLPVHVGDSLSADSLERIVAAVKQFDEHLAVSTMISRDGQTEIRIAVPGSGDWWEQNP